LSYTNCHKIAVVVVQNAIANETHIAEPDNVTRVFAAIKPLLMDEEDQGEEPQDPVLYPRSLLHVIFSIECFIPLINCRKVLKKSKIV
jgi:hypothetical protein